MDTGATFSPCGKYRYYLWRKWADGLPCAVFMMLNPSTADEVKNDPTVQRCQIRATQMGFGRLVVVNIFALRSTDPAELYKVADPIGPENNRYIIDAILEADLIVCAWGKHGQLKNRGERVLETVRQSGKIPHALKLNGDGSPAHPLYIGYDVKPIPIGA
jgi:hypothetical protein